MSRPDEEERVTRVTEGILLNPRLIGRELYESLHAPMRKLHNMIEMLDYMVDFSNAAQVHATTPGIVKRIWPELRKIYGDSYKGREIDEAKVSQWPQGFKSMVNIPRAKNPDPANMEWRMFEAQSTAVVDMMIAAELMDDADKCWPSKKDGFHVETITRVCLLKREFEHLVDV